MRQPYRVLYSNDVTHILACDSPYHPHGSRNLTQEMFRASIRETARCGVDVHMIQPIHGWWACWRGELQPLEEQLRFLRESNRTPDPFTQYLADGGDFMTEMIDECRRCGLHPFASVRMNDAHHGVNPPCRFYAEHPEWRLNPDGNSWNDRGQNWAVPEVRDYKFNLIRDLCEHVDLDGLELDFMRVGVLFRSWETTWEERRAVMTGYVARIRQMLDTLPGARRALSIRLPAHEAHRRAMGLDPAALMNAGADMFNFSHYFYTASEVPLKPLAEALPESSCYLEMTNCIGIGRSVEDRDGDTSELQQAGADDFYTTAAGAYAAGFAGVSLFNFVYTRRFGSEKKKGEYREPPFDLIPRLGDPEFLRKTPKVYTIGSTWEAARLPRVMTLFGQYTYLEFHNVLEAETDAVLLLSVETEGRGKWEAWFNDRPVTGERPFEWRIPRAFIRAGSNRLALRSCEGARSVILKAELKPLQE